MSELLATNDPIEQLMGKSVEKMVAAELVTYMKTYLNERYEIDLPVEGIVERKTLESFQRRYGQAKAGRIVQWVMLRRGGRKDGAYITPSAFCLAMKWWTDQVYLEIQQEQQREENRLPGQEEMDRRFFDMRRLKDML